VRTFGRYRLVEPLASGGMADVWRAEVTGPEGVVKEVALKLVRGEHARDGAFVRMFVQEARLAARLGHANVVQVFELVEADGRYGIAMELVRGRHLGQVVDRARERGVRLGVPRAVQIAADVARALAYAHRLTDGGVPLGLVHRDVSPHNVLVSFEGEVKLADFGIARAQSQAGLTEPGTLKGKLAYMAPEQARTAPLDARADVFSLGVVLWELCAGRRLFARETDGATFAAVVGDEPVSPPSAWNEEVPPELDAAILGALERDAGRRTRSAQDLAAALAAVLLRVTRSPEDVDLRAFMQRIFPAEADAAASGATALEATRVRARPGAGPVPGAGEPVAGEGGREGERAPEEGATRTAARPARRGRAVLAVVLGALAVAGIAVGARTWSARGGPEAPSSASAETVAPSPQPSPPLRGGEGGVPGDPTPAATPTPTASVVAPAARPSPPAGEGFLKIIAVPYGSVTVDGRAVGDSPVELRLPAGTHRVRVKGPRAVERDVTVRAGERVTETIPVHR
jgi:serine/threonine-protein kinase